MAWAEKQPSGKWKGLYRLPSGARRSVGTFTQKAEALRKANTAEEGSRQYDWHDPKAARISWADWCDNKWWPGRASSSSDASQLKTHLRPKWEHYQLGQITKQDVTEWVAELRRKPTNRKKPSLLSGATIRRAVALFSASLSAAVDAGVLKSNPAFRVGLPATTQAVERFLTVQEFDAIAAELSADIYDSIHLEIANFLVGTGARWGEMAGAKEYRIDRARGTVRIADVWDRAKKEDRAYPKGKKVRTVPIPGWAMPVKRLRRTDRLFEIDGKPVDPTWWSKYVWAPACLAAGVGHVRPHDLRHTYASWLLQGGLSLAEVGRLMGHQSWKTTERYAFLAEQNNQTVISALPTRGKPGANSPRTTANVVPIRP